MIIVKIHSGLGNQLFQYAFAKNLSIILKRPLKLDVSQIKKQEQLLAKSMYRLDKFKITADLIKEEELLDIMPQTSSNSLNKLLGKILKKKTDLFQNNKTLKITEANFNEFKENLDAYDYIYIDDYWGDQKYFEINYNLFKNDLSLSETLDRANSILKLEIESSSSVAIHVRRGDYLLQQNTFSILNKDYYEKAIMQIKASVKNPSFYVFSDDVLAAKNLLSPLLNNDQTKYLSHNNSTKDYFDLELMRSCKNLIMANSTFSWWAAWLMAEPKQIVIPNQWFNNPKMQQEYAQYKAPLGWIRL